MNNVQLNGEIITPSKIVCIGRNYVEHIKELGNEVPTEPVVFIKPNSSIAKQVETNETHEVHYEGEMCLLIKNKQIEGIGFGLDLTKRKLQGVLKSKGLPWERAKSFDKSAVFSHFVTCADDIQHYEMTLYINDILQQSANVELMIHKPAALLAEIESFMTLEDGDIIMTGTPKGVGVIKAGDTFTAKIHYCKRLVIEQSWRAL